MNQSQIRNGLNEELQQLFDRNRNRYNRLFENAREAIESQPPRLIIYKVFEPFSNGARYLHYTFKLTSIFGSRCHAFHRGDDLRTVNIFYPGHELPVQSVEMGKVITRKYNSLWGATS